MTDATDCGHRHESVINETLARFLRERRGLFAVAETLHDCRRPTSSSGLQEALSFWRRSLNPALTVEADALSRLGMTIDGRKIQNAFAVTVPGVLRSTSQRYLYERMAGATMVWQEWRIDGSSGPKLSGTPVELGNALQRTTPPTGDLNEEVDVLDEGARNAGALLHSSPGTLDRVSKILRTDPRDEAANMAALAVIDVIVLQEWQASSDAPPPPVSTATIDDRCWE